MKKTPLEIINTREVSLPKKHTCRFIRFLLWLMQAGSNVTYKYSFDKKQMKNKQVIILADHAVKDAYKYVLHGYPFITPNVVIGYQNIFLKGLFKLLVNGGIIPKKLYQPDQKSVVEMLKVLKLGGSLCIFPEGIQSTSGSTHPIFSATAKLLKRAGVTVVLCKSYGAYLVKPRFKTTRNKGRQEFHYEVLFTEQDLKDLSTEQIYDKLLERFSYNDFEWNKLARNKYSGGKKHPLAEGVETILYHCPKCNAEFSLKTEGEHIKCDNCGNDIILNEYYDLLPNSSEDVCPYSTIDEWFKAQRKIVRKEAEKGFCISYECEAFDVHSDKLNKEPFYPCGEGVITISNDGIHYKGTRHGQELDKFFDIKGIPSFVFTPNKDNDFYYDNVYYSFRPKTDRIKVVKYMLLIEEAHRLIDGTWEKISGDVYD